MLRRFLIDKEVGETPLQALERARLRKHIPAHLPMAYAGRLDPMASGKLLILVGDECKKQAEYHALDKEYVVEVLLGIESDTGDVLGITKEGPEIHPSKDAIREVLKEFVGLYRAPYPAYSSKTVDGKPLFQWTLEKRLNEIEVPLQDGTIRDVRFKGMRNVTNPWLLQYVQEKIGLLATAPEESKALGRDFRKEEVLASWRQVLTRERYVVVKIRVRTSSGVYMRTLAQDIGKKLGTSALALSIRRTKILL